MEAKSWGARESPVKAPPAMTTVFGAYSWTMSAVIWPSWRARSSKMARTAELDSAMVATSGRVLASMPWRRTASRMDWVAKRCSEAPWPSTSEWVCGSGMMELTSSSTESADPKESSAKSRRTRSFVPISAAWVSEPKMAEMAEVTTTGTLNWKRRRAAISTPCQPRLSAVTRPSSSTVPEVVIPKATSRRSRPVIMRLMPAMMCSRKSSSVRRATGVAISSSETVRPLMS